MAFLKTGDSTHLGSVSPHLIENDPGLSADAQESTRHEAAELLKKASELLTKIKQTTESK